MSTGRSHGISQAPSRVKFDPKRYKNGGQNGGQNCLDWARQMIFCSFESRIKFLASQCVYLHGTCAENPSRHPLGPKTFKENKKYVQIFEFVWLGGKTYGG